MIKGTPPFSRELSRRTLLTRSSAGLGEELRCAARRPILRGARHSLLRTAGSVWLVIHAERSLRVGIRLASEANGFSRVTARSITRGIEVMAAGGSGKHFVKVQFGDECLSSLHLRTTLVPRMDLKWESGAREVCLMDARLEPLDEGLIYTNQTGPTAGLAFVSASETFVFYFQNLTALGPFSRYTGTRLEGCVGVEWPELGLNLPPGNNPLPAGREVVLTDTFLRLNAGPVDSEAAAALRFMDDLYSCYLELPRREPEWFDWQKLAADTLSDLSRSKSCTRKIRGGTYFNAYVGSTDKPPESMVQAAVLVPLLEYEAWLGKPVPLVKRLDETMGTFFDEKLQCPVRWLPGCKFLKAEPGEEEVTGRIDSWYLFHTLMNLGRLAALGRPRERELFLSSLEYAIHTARHFKYEWPVFFDMESLKVYKRETDEGHGGEQDVPGLYAHVMLQAWDLTREPVYLKEAETAAEKLQCLGFGVLYQTNNTMFGAVALAWLWRETGNTLYKDLSFVCMGSILSHLWLWEPEIEGRSWRTFMGLPPLHDAPYIAAYEEAEIFATLAPYLDVMGDDSTGGMTGLLVEYGKTLLDRARFYFPSCLQPDSLSDEPKEGVMDPHLTIPVEDLYSTGAKAGQVGQEVYGAALALILASRSNHRWKGIPLTVWCNAPIRQAEFEKGDGNRGSLSFRIAGSPECRYDLRLLSVRPGVRFTIRTNRVLRTVANAEGHPLFHLKGEDRVTIRWLRG